MTMGEKIIIPKSEADAILLNLDEARKQIRSLTDKTEIIVAAVQEEFLNRDKEIERLRAEAERLQIEKAGECLELEMKFAKVKADNERMKARIGELTQGDPSWFDASPADASRMLKQYKAEVEKLNERVEELVDSLHRTGLDRERMRLNYQGSEGVIYAVIDAIGGKVEGHPTSSLNFLQRVRELVNIEADRDRLKGWLERIKKTEAAENCFCETCCDVDHILREMEKGKNNGV